MGMSRMQYGHVTHINASRQMFVVQYAAGYSVFEMLEPVELEVGSGIAGEDLGDFGDCTLYFEVREPFKAFGQSGSCSLEAALKLIA